MAATVVAVEPTISVSLSPQTLRHHLDFLRTVSEMSHLSHNDPDVVSNAVRRYEQCWLPLAAAATNSQSLSPPVDVHWVWHCHMLSPYHYELDCVSLVGKVVDHSVKSSTQLTEQRRTTADVWTHNYHDEPFDVTDVQPSTHHRSSLSYDLMAAVRRQSKFFYQVSLPHYHDDRFLQQAVARYRKLLSLKARHRDALLVPSYDIDVVWHTHQLHPVSYKHDTEALLGRMLNHDDSLDDRSPGSAQQDAYKTTRQLWLGTYQEHYALTGAMYRGDQPHGRLTLCPPHDPANKKLVLRLVSGSFESCTMPEHVEQLWGPVPLPRLPQGTDNTCLAASHTSVYAPSIALLSSYLALSF